MDHSTHSTLAHFFSSTLPPPVFDRLGDVSEKVYTAKCRDSIHPPTTRLQLFGRQRAHLPRNLSGAPSCGDNRRNPRPSTLIRRKYLRSCSLVVKSWLGPSQRRLFASVFVDMESHQSWLDNISPRNTGLFHHVRSLVYVVRREPGSHPPCRPPGLFTLVLPTPEPHPKLPGHHTNRSSIH